MHKTTIKFLFKLGDIVVELKEELIKKMRTNIYMIEENTLRLFAIS